MLQRLAQFCVAFLEFLEQAHVLDGDDGLVGEGLEQRNLLFRERSDFCSTNHDRPDRYTLTQQRRGKDSASTVLAESLHPETRSQRLQRDHGHESSAGR